MTVDYVTDCPHCGAQLAAHVGPGQNAPWLCAGCARGWWVAELRPDARRAYRPEFHDHGFDVAVLHAARLAERDAAFARGCSLTLETIGTVSADQLTSAVTMIAGRNHPDASLLLAAIRAHQAAG